MVVGRALVAGPSRRSGLKSGDSGLSTELRSDRFEIMVNMVRFTTIS
jgi:hypothetical protein